MKTDQLNKKPILARKLFLSAVREFISQVSHFKERAEDIWVNHRKELILKPDLEKCVEYALTAEYILKPIQDYYSKNRYYLETDAYLLQRVLDKYLLGKILEYSSIDTKKFAEENITSVYTVKSNKGEFLLLETPNVKTTKEYLQLCKKLCDVGPNKPIGAKHTFDRYFYIYQFVYPHSK